MGDHNGQQFVYVYFEDQPARRSPLSCLLKMRRGGSRPISAKLPELFIRGGKALRHRITMSGGTHGCLGHLLSTAKGWRAYDADDKPLGTLAVQAVLTRQRS